MSIKNATERCAKLLEFETDPSKTDLQNACIVYKIFVDNPATAGLDSGKQLLLDYIELAYNPQNVPALSFKRLSKLSDILGYEFDPEIPCSDTAQSFSTVVLDFIRINNPVEEPFLREWLALYKHINPACRDDIA